MVNHPGKYSRNRSYRGPYKKIEIQDEDGYHHCKYAHEVLRVILWEEMDRRIITYAKVAEEIGYTEASVSAWARGARDFWRSGAIKPMAKFLGISPDILEALRSYTEPQKVVVRKQTKDGDQQLYLRDDFKSSIETKLTDLEARVSRLEEDFSSFIKTR